LSPAAYSILRGSIAVCKRIISFRFDFDPPNAPTLKEGLMISTIVRTAGVFAVGGFVALCLLPAARLATAAGLYTTGHGDVRVYYEAGELKIRYQLDYNSLVDGVEVGTYETGPQSFGLNGLVTYVPDVPIELPPDLPAYDFLGASAGDPLWYIPEVQEDDRPWLGFSSQELSLDDWIGPTIGDVPNYGLLGFDLVSVTGPADGYFSLFQTGPGGDPAVQFATLNGIDGADSYGFGSPFPGFPTSTHAHASWFFTKPGIYDVTLKFSGTHVVDGYKEAIGTVRFAVAVPEPSAACLTSAMIAITTASLRRTGRRRI
jgi:surface-anchored protein